MSLVFEFGIILAVCLAGELLHALLPLPVPASIYGLCLLLLLLLTGVVKEKHIARAAGFLLGIMSLLFVPAAAGILSVWDEAKRLLAVTKKSAVEIAEYLGYSSQSYFVKVFKKIHGVTPGKFRKG